MAARVTAVGRALLLGIVLSGAPVLLCAESFPSVPVQTLGGKALSLPVDLSDAAALFVIGFTQTSEKQTVVWRKNADRAFAGDPMLRVYPVLVIQSIPRIFRGLLLAGVRAGVAKNTWARFLVVTADEKLWKEAVGWQGPDRAYLVLIDRRGEIVWRYDGPFSDAQMSSLRRAVDSLSVSIASP